MFARGRTSMSFLEFIIRLNIDEYTFITVMSRFKVLSVPLDFSDANFCPLNSGPLDFNRLKIIDDILNRLKCQNVRWQKHITEEPIRKHFISMPWTVVSSKFGVHFITITNVILLVIYIIIAASCREDETSIVI